MENLPKWSANILCFYIPKYVYLAIIFVMVILTEVLFSFKPTLSHIVYNVLF